MYYISTIYLPNELTPHINKRATVQLTIEIERQIIIDLKRFLLFSTQSLILKELEPNISSNTKIPPP